jgi:hypothetical protein
LIADAAMHGVLPSDVSDDAEIAERGSGNALS